MWPCALCYSILKILCQLLQTAPDAVTDTAWVYTLRCGDLTHTHTQVIPGIDPLGLLLWQSHHSGIELLPQLLFLQKHLRCLRLQQHRIFNAILAIQRILCFEKANETRQNNLQSATVSLQVVIGLCKRKETAALKIKAAVS